MKKVLSIAMCIAIMLSLTVETFAVSADETTDTVETTENSADNLVSYNGTIEELPITLKTLTTKMKKRNQLIFMTKTHFHLLQIILMELKRSRFSRSLLNILKMKKLNLLIQN